MTFEPDSILTSLKAHAGRLDLAVAFSGGLDSTVLLHSLVQLKLAGELDNGLRALHVNHGISPRAGHWQAFCVDLCEKLGVPLEVASLRVEAAPGESLEAVAREARYAWFSDRIGASELLLLAHHLDDQMETLLLRLLRGSGPGSLGMPSLRIIGQTILIRPLLSFPRAALEDYARRAKLEWIEDESNASIAFDRNYLRHQVLPLIEARWPGFRASWQKSLELCSDAGLLVAMTAHDDLGRAATEDRRILRVEPLQSLASSNQRNALRHWLTREGFPEPGWHGLLRISRELIGDGDSNPGVPFEDAMVQRYRDKLFLLGARRLSNPEVPTGDWSPLEQSAFDLESNGSLTAQTVGPGPAADSIGGRLRCDLGILSVRYRSGGESCRLAGRPTKRLKALLQEAAVAPWLRDRIPLLYVGDRLACIPGIGVAAEFATEESERGLSIRWNPPDLLYR